MIIPKSFYLKLFLIPLILIALLGCVDKKYDFYRVEKNNKKLIQLFELIDKADESNEESIEVYFTIINQIISEYSILNEIDKMNLFLTDYINSHKNDPYTAYYLLTIAGNYKKDEAEAVAEIYYRNILFNYHDLIINNQSIHKLVLEELAYNSDDYEERIYCFKELLNSFPGDINKGSVYYYLSKSYEFLGMWEDVFESYENFLKYPETKIPGDPDANVRITDLLNFHKSNKSWTRDNLNSLVSSIQSAIYTRNGNALKRLQAEKFFTMSWSQEDTDRFTHAKLDITPFLSLGPRYSRELDPMSNENEAYLKTTRWSYRIKTWYLYFKKINYPADPEINGRWEWAGIYFGDYF